MPETRKTSKILPKNRDNVTKDVADDLVCVPRRIFEQMKSIIKGLDSNGGRAKNLLAEIETIK